MRFFVFVFAICQPIRETYPSPAGNIFTVHMSCANTNKTLVTCMSLLTCKHKILAGGDMFPVLHLNSETRSIVE